MRFCRIGVALTPIQIPARAQRAPFQEPMMNAVRHDLTPFEALEDIVRRYGFFAILRALVAHRIGRRRRARAVRPVDIPARLRRDVGLPVPWPDRERSMDVVNYR